MISRRYELLRQAEYSPDVQELLLEQCRRDILFWFEHFCWTFDPRLNQPHQAFRLYPFQKELVMQLAHVIDKGDDLLIEKSRDMGVSWLILLTFQYYWLFHPGSQFLIGSRKMDLVDKKGDLSTLFEKLRYNLRWLPSWMQPKGFKPIHHDSLHKLIHPEHGNAIVGESSTVEFGRGGRYKGVFMDEFPFWDYDEQAFASSGQSTPCRILVGTPYGKNNKFAQLRFDSPIQVKSLHWKLHPEKDETWYQNQIRRMSPDEIARELDINYNLSLSNRVFSGFGEKHKREKLAPILGRRILRSWDFGFHFPACVFVQIDDYDRVLVLHEMVGHQELLKHFAERVLKVSDSLFPEFEFEDICDPAGSQRSDKSDKTSIDILNNLGVYPFFQRSLIISGIERIRMKLAAETEGIPTLLIHHRCRHLIDAFEGGYRYASTDHELPYQEHPYEDVMDCLRYAVVYKCGIASAKTPKASRKYRPIDPYTGY